MKGKKKIETKISYKKPNKDSARLCKAYALLINEEDVLKFFKVIKKINKKKYEKNNH